MSIHFLLCLLMVVVVGHTVQAKIKTRRSLENAVQKAMKKQGSRHEHDLSTYAANVILDTTQILLDKGFTIEEVTSDTIAADIREILLVVGVVKESPKLRCKPNHPYRTLNGSCNNLDHPEWGQSVRPQRRVLAPAYEKGSIGTMRATGINGKPLPNPRKVSNVVHSNTKGVTSNSTTITLITFQFGQFVDHDIITTPLIDDETCCGPNESKDCIPIRIPRGDPFFRDG
ncbi:hypothetical protein CHS0354_035150, partial [Potamilus streckersoni]